MFVRCVGKFDVSKKRFQKYACIVAVAMAIALAPILLSAAAAPEDEAKGYPDIKVRKPNGGEIWVRGEKEAIPRIRIDVFTSRRFR